jgi:hypothetical protein
MLSEVGVVGNRYDLLAISLNSRNSLHLLCSVVRNLSSSVELVL